MSDEQEVQDLHAALKPRAVSDYVQFFLSRTKPEWHSMMESLVDADLANPDSGIAYAYIDPQTVTAAQPVTMQSGEQHGNKALFAPRPGGNGIAFAQPAIIEMQVWFPITDNASGQGIVTFSLKKGSDTLQRSSMQMVGAYVLTNYFGIMLPGDDVSLMAVAPSGDVRILEGGYATVIATPVQM